MPEAWAQKETSRRCPRYLDEEAVADVADLHGVGVHLPDVLLHLQDGAAVQGELPFLLQGHGRTRHLLGNWHTRPFSRPVPLLPQPEKSPERGRGLYTPHPTGFCQPQPAGIHAGLWQILEQGNLGKT